MLENPGGLDRTDDLVARTAIRAMIAFFAAGARGASWFPAAFAAYYRMVLQRGAAAEERRRIVASAREIAPLLRDAWSGFGEPEADLRHRFAGARLETFPAGHAPHLETPDEFESVLERFLEPLRHEELPAHASRAG